MLCKNSLQINCEFHDQTYALHLNKIIHNIFPAQLKNLVVEIIYLTLKPATKQHES